MDAVRPQRSLYKLKPKLGKSLLIVCLSLIIVPSMVLRVKLTETIWRQFKMKDAMAISGRSQQDLVAIRDQFPEKGTEEIAQTPGVIQRSEYKEYKETYLDHNDHINHSEESSENQQIQDRVNSPGKLDGEDIRPPVSVPEKRDQVAKMLTPYNGDHSGVPLVNGELDRELATPSDDTLAEGSWRNVDYQQNEHLQITERLHDGHQLPLVDGDHNEDDDGEDNDETQTVVGFRPIAMIGQEKLLGEDGKKVLEDDRENSGKEEGKVEEVVGEEEIDEEEDDEKKEEEEDETEKSGSEVNEIVGYIGCKNVLSRAVVGRWVPRSYDERELEKLQRFLNNTREHMGLPKSLQREDGKCGNVSFGEYSFGDKITWRWFRALCNPFGPTACCFHGQCVAKSVDQCDCLHCMDMRQPIHSELAEWVPKDKNCQLIHYTRGKEACNSLDGFTIHFLGDSLIRQIFVAMIHLLDAPEPKVSAKDEFHQCKGYYAYLPYCARYLPYAIRPCGDMNVLVRRTFVWRSHHTNKLLRQLSRYVDEPNSVVVVGMGMHDHLNSELISDTVAKPITETLRSFNSTWPKLVWVSPHAPGLLKSPWAPSQLAPAVSKFNNRINPVFTSAGVSVLETYDMTSQGVMTYDGLHYGEGLNTLKVQVLLNYIQELRVDTNSLSTSKDKQDSHIT